ncbi:MAG TPA: hypothetical protein VK191_05935 [Symbiobacteriaceae bacterium]|nr:hypothetical protein [Symbiobacteriaceae bacterium]
MALPALTVSVDGKEVRLFVGAEVKHALNWAGGHELIARVTSGSLIVWDETAGAPTDLGGALYEGQRLAIRPA